MEILQVYDCKKPGDTSWLREHTSHTPMLSLVLHMALGGSHALLSGLDMRKQAENRWCYIISTSKGDLERQRGGRSAARADPGHSLWLGGEHSLQQANTVYIASWTRPEVWPSCKENKWKIRDKAIVRCRLVGGHMGVGTMCECFCITLSHPLETLQLRNHWIINTVIQLA